MKTEDLAAPPVVSQPEDSVAFMHALNEEFEHLIEKLVQAKNKQEGFLAHTKALLSLCEKLEQAQALGIKLDHLADLQNFVKKFDDIQKSETWLERVASFHQSARFKYLRYTAESIGIGCLGLATLGVVYSYGIDSFIYDNSAYVLGVSIFWLNLELLHWCGKHLPHYHE